MTGLCAAESHPSASADSDGAKPATGATANSTTARPEQASSTDNTQLRGGGPLLMITPMAPPADKAGAAGFSIGLLQGAIPGAAARDATLRATGTGPVGSRSFERFKYFGQMLGGLALTAFGMGGSAGGIALNATGIGAAVGVPAVAVSYTVAMAGIANTVAGFEGMLQSLATGGSAGPPGVSAGPAAPGATKSRAILQKKFGPHRAAGNRGAA